MEVGNGIMKITSNVYKAARESSVVSQYLEYIMILVKINIGFVLCICKYIRGNSFL